MCGGGRRDVSTPRRGADDACEPSVRRCRRRRAVSLFVHTLPRLLEHRIANDAIDKAEGLRQSRLSHRWVQQLRHDSEWVMKMACRYSHSASKRLFLTLLHSHDALSTGHTAALHRARDTDPDTCFDAREAGIASDGSPSPRSSEPAPSLRLTTSTPTVARRAAPQEVAQGVRSKILCQMNDSLPAHSADAGSKLDTLSDGASGAAAAAATAAPARDCPPVDCLLTAMDGDRSFAAVAPAECAAEGSVTNSDASARFTSASSRDASIDMVASCSHLAAAASRSS